MSKMINGIPVIFAEPPQKCEMCGKIAETRPYGKDGAEVCFECGMKDKATTEKMCKKILFGMGDEDEVANKENLF